MKLRGRDMKCGGRPSRRIWKRNIVTSKNCDADATEEAQDMLQRVRKVMASGGPLPAKENSFPGAYQVIYAKTVVQQCEQMFTALDLAELELFLAQEAVWFAMTSEDVDARVDRKYHEKHEREGKIPFFEKLIFGNTRFCNEKQIRAAKEILARVRKVQDEAQANLTRVRSKRNAEAK